MSTITIEVTADDIAAGAANHACKCPIALAILRIIPGSHPWVYGPYVTFTATDSNLDKIVEVKAPESAERFVELFDEDEPVAPFEFGIDVPDEVLSKARGEATS